MPKTIELSGRVETDLKLIRTIEGTGTWQGWEGTIKWFGDDVRENIEPGDLVKVPERSELGRLGVESVSTHPGEDGVSYLLLMVRTP